MPIKHLRQSGRLFVQVTVDRERDVYRGDLFWYEGPGGEIVPYRTAIDHHLIRTVPIASVLVAFQDDPVHTMNEAWRVLAPGGWLMISVPSTNGLGAFCDPTHKSFWNKLSFRYYVDKRFARYVSGYRGRFQLGRDPLEWFPTPWHKAENVPYAEAHLFANKDGWRAMGAVMI